MVTTHYMPLRMRMVWEVLEAAKDAGDEFVIAACRRCIVADRLGWKKHYDGHSLEIVKAFAQ